MRPEHVQTRPVAHDTSKHQLDHAVRLRDRSVVLLAALSGATDAVGLMALGGAFTSVMTGNLVLVGVSIGIADATFLAITLAAIVGYVVGVWVGAKVAGEPQADDPIWPRAVTIALMVEATLFAIFAIGWWSLGSMPEGTWFIPLVAIASMALGVQSSAIIRFGVSGLSTTYMTGTLTTIVTRIAAHHPLSSVGRSAALLVGLVVGAAVAGLLHEKVPVLIPVLQLGLIGTSLAIAVTVQRVARQAASNVD